ncbi:AsmA family protein [Bombella saccharophila]|uniref:AsmA family protein n=1 Tax=Bombella saccharophila TaxID=2967338 RepID=A0ABT3W3W5_9PROT|nr:AsmA family protein [Bombella saccharophila]MCX5613745.1 AsmA family protein [Bombella saccharophila]
MKKLAASLIGLVVVLTGISLAPQFLIDQNHLRERVTAVFQAQTGLELKMGETSFQLLPWPSFQATNVVLTRPGCSPFVVARSVHADMSLFALLNRDVSFQDFTINGAGVMLHRASEGQCSTWLPVMSQPAQGGAVPAAMPGHLLPRWKVSFGALHLKNATLSWQDDLSDGEVPISGRVQITRLELEGMRSASPWVDLSGQYEHTPFTLRGRMGPLERLLSAKAEQKGPWPFSLGMTLGDGTQQDHATLDGTMSDAHRLQGLAFTLEGHWASLKRLHRLFPHFMPVEMEQLDGTLRLHAVDVPHKVDAGLDKGADVALTDALLHVPQRLRPDVIHLHLGHVTAPTGLQLRDVRLDAENGQAPLIMQGKATKGRYAWLFHGEVQSLQQAVMAGLPGDSTPVMVKMELQGEDKTLASLFNQSDTEKGNAAQEHVSFALQGQIGRTGSMLDVSGQAHLLQLPDWGWFSGLLLHDVHLKGQLAFGAIEEAGLPSVTLHDLVFESQEIGGSAAMVVPAPLGAAGLTGQIHLAHMDETRFHYAPIMEFAGGAAEPSVPTLSLGAALKTVEQPPATSMPSGESRSSGDRYIGAQYAGSHEMEAEAHRGQSHAEAAFANLPGHDGPLARWLGALAVQPLDIDFTADHLQSTEVEYQGLHLHLLGHEGHLVLSVLGGAVQTVSLSGEIVLDGSTEPLRMGMKADPLILPARWVQLALNQPVTVEGPIQLVGALGTEGAHPSDLLQAIEGQMGLSIVDGRIHREVLAPLAGPAARLLKLGDGTMGLRCAAGVVQFNHGQVHFGDMALEVKHLSVLGQGSMALADQSYTLQLMPHVSVIGADFSTPLLLEGKGGSVHIGTAGKDGVPALPPLDTAKFGDDACAYAVQQARAGRQGLPLPEREQDHGGGAGGILRALGLGGH